jgi:hypothetical protein
MASAKTTLSHHAVVMNETDPAHETAVAFEGVLTSKARLHAGTFPRWPGHPTARSQHCTVPDWILRAQRPGHTSLTIPLRTRCWGFWYGSDSLVRFRYSSGTHGIALAAGGTKIAYNRHIKFHAASRG